MNFLKQQFLQNCQKKKTVNVQERKKDTFKIRSQNQSGFKDNIGFLFFGRVFKSRSNLIEKTTTFIYINHRNISFVGFQYCNLSVFYMIDYYRDTTF